MAIFCDASPPQKNVLIICSYHAGDTWTDNIVQGIQASLASRSDISLRFEYLDSWRHADADHERIFQAYLAEKYKDVPLDAAIVADDAALALFAKMRSTVFPDLPMVCCGINSLDRERLARIGQATGVNEAIDITGTLDLAARLFPDARRLVVMAADHGLGKTNLDIFRREYAKQPHRFEVQEILNLTPENAPGLLGAIPKNAVALRLTTLEVDRSSMNRQESMALTSGWCNAPVFTCWDFDMGHGAVGGRVVSALAQGRAAGELANRILAGEKAADIPPVMDSPNTVMLDFTQLERFDVPDSRLPADAVILNKPFSVYERYKAVIWSTLAALAGMGICIMWLLVALAAKKKAEKELRAQRDFMDALLETVPIPIFHKDKDGRYTGCNRAFEQFTGISRARIAGKTVHETAPPELAEKYEAMDRDLFASSGRQRYEWKYRDDRGELRDVIFHKAVIRDGDGTVCGIIGAISDITERVGMEAALRKSEERFRTLVQSAGDAIYLAGLDGRILEVNPEAQRQTGFSRAELLAMRVLDLDVHQTEAGLHDMAANLGDGDLVVFATEHRTKSGGRFPVELRVVRVTSEGRPMLLGVARDITARKRDEAALLQAKEAADDANRAKSEFLAVMSHEIRTPLNGIMGMLQLLADSGLNATQREGVETALSCSRGLLRILSDILDISRIEAGRYRLAEEDFQLVDILDPVMEVFAGEAEKKGLDFSLRVDPALPGRLRGDPGRIRQILFNLVGNAVKYTPAGFVRIEIYPLPYCPRPDAVCVHVEVADSGIGIPDDKLGAVFGLFTQVENAYTRTYGGSGLGLAIVRRLVRLMDGELSVASEVGSGTQIHLTLKLPIATLGHEVLHRTAPAMPTAPSERKTLLVVEDETVNRITLKALLRRLGYDCTAVDNGRMALEELKKGGYDGVLMDIQMPEMDGLETTRRIRAASPQDFDPGMPVIAVTAHAMAGDRENFLAAGMQDYIAKPVELGVLKEVLDRYFPLAGSGTA